MTPPSSQSSNREIERPDENQPKPVELQPLSDTTASTQLTPTPPLALFILGDFLLISVSLKTWSQPCHYRDHRVKTEGKRRWRRRRPRKRQRQRRGKEKRLQREGNTAATDLHQNTSRLKQSGKSESARQHHFVVSPSAEVLRSWFSYRQPRQTWMWSRSIN